MKPEHLWGLRECCRDDAAFAQMQQILRVIEAERQQSELGKLHRTFSKEQDGEAVLAIAVDDGEEVNKPQRGDRDTNSRSSRAPWQPTSVEQSEPSRAIQEREQRFRALIENAADVIAILDETGVFHYCSPSTERILGYTATEVIGHTAMEFVHPDDIAQVMQVLMAAIQQPAVSQPAVEYRVRHRNGSWCIFEAVTTSLLNEPVIQGVVINCHDITERKQAERGLRSANRKIINILESITDAFMSLDTRWRFTYLNQRAAQLLQRSPQDLLGQTLWDAFPEAVGSTFDREYHRALEHQIPITFEEFYPPLNTWFEVRVFPSVDGLSIFLLDVTERRQAQAELLEMSTALGNAVEGIARLDLEGRYIALNRAYAAALGYSQEEMIGMPWQKTVHPDDIPLLLTAYAQMQTEGKATIEATALCKDGSTFYKEVTMVAAYDWHDQLTGHHCFTRDITERKRSEATLRQQAERERLIAAIAQRIRYSLNLEEILNTTVVEVRQFLRADRVVIYHIDSNQNGIVRAESVETSWKTMIGFRLTADWFKQRQEEYRQGKNIVVDDISQMQFCDFRTFLENAQIRAMLVVPILHNRQLWGILAVHQCSQVRHWEAFEISLSEQLATQLAIALQQSELYQQVQQLNAELEAQVQERTAQLQQALQFEAMLKRITDSVRDSLDEDQILQTAVKELALGLDIDACDAALYDLEQHTSTIAYEHLCPTLSPVKGACVPMQRYQGIFDQLLREQCIQFCRIVPDLLRSTSETYAILACPMVGDQGVIGDLWLFKAQSQAFTHSEIRLVQQIANQCAIAVRQARLFQASQAEVAALEKLNRLKDDFLSTVSHELRTPMSNIKMAIHMLRKDTTGDRRERYLEILQTECTREIELINDLLDLQRLEASSYPISLQTIELDQVLQAVVAPFQNRVNDRQQTLKVDLPPTLPDLSTDQSSLERILAELLNNACKYTPPDSEVSFRVHLEPFAPNTPGITFEIGNQAEIPALELPRIFEKFYRVPNADPWKQGGTGLGLALVQRLVIQLGGTIQVDSKDNWTAFTIRLPLTHNP